MTDPYQPPAMPSQPPPPPAGPPVPTEDERMMGMLCHLLGLFTGFVGPLILWLVKKDESAFIDHHGKESLNFQLTFLLFVGGLSVMAAILSLIFIGLLLVPVILVLILLAVIAEILTCVSASRGEWSRYPGCIRFIA
jgi:uncharacterized Tic20 family protein